MCIRDRPREETAGTHHPDGIVIACGPGVQAGRQKEARRIEDVAALVLHSLGLAIPEDFEGQVPVDFFTEEHLRSHPVIEGGVTQSVAGTVTGEAMEEDEKDKLMAQLQMLGYVD